jgi:hypothetical protein
MIDRTEERFGLKPKQLAADTAYGSATMLNWLVNETPRPVKRVTDTAAEIFAMASDDGPRGARAVQRVRACDDWCGFSPRLLWFAAVLDTVLA